MTRTVWSILVVSLLPIVSTAAGEAPEANQLRSALERSVVYLQREGRSWFDGNVDVQHQACVS